MASNRDHPPALLMGVDEIEGVDDTAGALVGWERGCGGCTKVGSRCCTRHSWSVSWVGGVPVPRDPVMWEVRRWLRRGLLLVSLSLLLLLLLLLLSLLQLLSLSSLLLLWLL